MPAQKANTGFTPEEQAAMKERAAETKRPRGSKTDPEAEVLAKIAELPQPERNMAEKLHTIIKNAAPSLTPKTWYGMPAYALNGKVVCFFQSASKFKTRYATLGFNDTAKLDDGRLWPTAYALAELTPEVEKKIVELVKKAVQ